jgi:hypothetical protein
VDAHPPNKVELPIAVRAHVPRRRPRATRRVDPGPGPTLTLDVETTVDAAQRLLFGSARVHDQHGRLRRELIFHDDDLPGADVAVLQRYCQTHVDERGGRIRLLTRADFLEGVFWQIAYRAGGRVIGYHLAYDLSRVAIGSRTARKGGFTLRLYGREIGGELKTHVYRPELTIRAFGPKRHFFRFTGPARGDRPADGQAAYRGRFTDCHTLAHALTDRDLSLAAAAEAFGLTVAKGQIDHRGEITEAYVDYNRQDVRVTYELFRVLEAELARHPIGIAPEAATSTAALAKGYLRVMGSTPLLDRRPAIPDRVLGAAATAYYGGRAEVRVRLQPMPVRYLDFTSMYPTVFALGALWDWVIADHFEATDITRWAAEFCAGADPPRLLDRTNWPLLAGVFCRLAPDGQILPVRAPYSAGRDGSPGTSWTIGVNPLTSRTELWYTLADLVAGVLLGGKPPSILEAVRVAPVGRLGGLQPIELRGNLRVEPDDDVFRHAMEERQRARRAGGPEAERYAAFLKTLANSGSYGIFAEYHDADPVAAGTRVRVHGLWPMRADVRVPEEPGEFCYPPMASTITGLARLLLATLQATVEDLGGTYVACDTDSLLVVASERGGPVGCPGGPYRTSDGREAVHALSYAEIDAIRSKLNVLNPYDPSVVPDLVKLEPENQPADPALGPLRAVAVSAKRYALYRIGPGGPVIVKASNHGLGLFRSPDGRRPGWHQPWPEWVDHAWSGIIREAEGLPPPEPPARLDLPALSQLPISSPAILAPFEAVNRGRPYGASVKPHGFLLVGHADPLTSVGRMVPIRPFASDPAAAMGPGWLNRVDGSPIEVTTRPSPRAGVVRLRTLADILLEYARHPEYKSADPAGGRGLRSSRGVLPRLAVEAAGLPVHIGKESNRLDEEESGAVLDAEAIYAEYHDARAEWTAVVPALRRIRRARGWRILASASGLSERAIRYALDEGRLPHEPARSRLLRLVREEGATRQESGLNTRSAARGHVTG